ncbi:hypothetical protein M409DRAFT_51396 [Zasmidium cellare ATCC 36951]|uniref:FAD-binding domain-containing protein n=1 Tax=Zasmidium cellare ATCC 36951 TaxID=1080233 RepID=A0A6A6CWX9_ZASCE|nr:uncharacterized protein M409DRAFT_51396 [Zasmidium cellare ATCC 36951]KAF2170342.1 hypothetical protein M409DRAFT_51396 [Zasmidium cellare ATCC 36951]
MTINISIIGGGVAGFCLAHALLKHPEITFDIYEKHDEIRAIGQGLLLQSTARQSLRLMDPDLGSYPEEIGGAELKLWTVAMGEGPYRGQLSHQISYPKHERPIGVDRTKLMSKLLQKIPKERLHTGKRVTSVKDSLNSSKRYNIQFDDGTSLQTDAIIGADGLRSYIRHLVIQEWPADKLVPRPSGLWDGRILIPAARARALLKDHISHPLTEGAVMLVGTKGNIYFSLHEDWEYAACIVAGWKEQTASSPWRFPLSAGFLDENFGDGWGMLGKGVKDTILQLAEPEGFFEWDINPLPTFHKERMCLIGDAAHSAVPWLAAGATIGVEDAAILGALLNQVHSVSELNVAFAEFTATQIDRSHTLISNSRHTARNMVEGASTIPAELARNDRPLKDFLFDVDMKERIKVAVSSFLSKAGARK